MSFWFVWSHRKLNASYFWPGSFARSDEIDTVLEGKKFYYGCTVLVMSEDRY